MTILSKSCQIIAKILNLSIVTKDCKVLTLWKLTTTPYSSRVYRFMTGSPSTSWKVTSNTSKSVHDTSGTDNQQYIYWWNKSQGETASNLSSVYESSSSNTLTPHIIILTNQNSKSTIPYDVEHAEKLEQFLAEIHKNKDKPVKLEKLSYVSEVLSNNTNQCPGSRVTFGDIIEIDPPDLQTYLYLESKMMRISNSSI